MKTLLLCSFVLFVLSCQNRDTDDVSTRADTVLDEYPDWHTIKAPIDREIQGVWGNWDKTLLISTSYIIFRSTDQGGHWQQVHQQSTGMFGVVQNGDTLFTMSGLLSQTPNNPKAYQELLTTADNYSLDDGQTWQRYTGHNRLLSDIPTYDSVDKRLRTNPVITNAGDSYKINRVFLDGPTATTGIFETPGVITATGRRIDLPQLHQLQSLYLDEQQRLYIAGTDAVCGRGHSGATFAFCNSKQGRGVVYISKKPLP